MKKHALIMAAGRATRAGFVKQFALMGGQPLIFWSLEAFKKAEFSSLTIVTSAENVPLAEALILPHFPEVRICLGGETRAHSVKCGLEYLSSLAKTHDQVFIHDAARPLYDLGVLQRLSDEIAKNQGAIAAMPVTDSLKRSENDAICEAVSRENMWRAQTPQAFEFGNIHDAYQHHDITESVTDDAYMATKNGITVKVVKGHAFHEKITFKEDLNMAEKLFSPEQFKKQKTHYRIGHGFDAHRLGEGHVLILCGVKIDHHQGLIGHSDADVGLHALTDALLGAMALGDIGAHFPPSDPQWKGKDSRHFLHHAAHLVRQAGGEIENVDVTLICEAPKISPYREEMRTAIADTLTISREQVSIKATTTEKMGFTGRSEGIAAQATASIVITQKSDG